MKKNPEKKLTEVSQSEVVTLAVYFLGGARRAIDTEDVAVEAHRLGADSRGKNILTKST
jgi:hypothetical protein